MLHNVASPPYFVTAATSARFVAFLRHKPGFSMDIIQLFVVLCHSQARSGFTWEVHAFFHRTAGMHPIIGLVA